MSRTVRRVFLCGIDNYSGQSLILILFICFAIPKLINIQTTRTDDVCIYLTDIILSYHIDN
ncbi:hypothetical protein Ssed_2714 [Shewanella sediminis HAW-EB3]|uniref:Uncharacterized protein n=1 Tax=Shewanella sediminis (strain HAW-EB3) TaxID=425104 RepID=A8FWU8_SHESH|nr:hypothetical protein Ssed_2714 [Shewanella sediminis HAW-EB3]